MADRRERIAARISELEHLPRTRHRWETDELHRLKARLHSPDLDANGLTPDERRAFSAHPGYTPPPRPPSAVPLSEVELARLDNLSRHADRLAPAERRELDEIVARLPTLTAGD